MKAVLISTNRPHTDNIKALIKTLEIRKGKPSQPTPFPCYIYETKSKGGCGKVIGEFVCDKIEEIQVRYAGYGLGYNEKNTWKIGNDVVVFERNDRYIDSMFTPKEIEDTMRLTCEELYEYLKSKHNGYAWHISQLKIYDKPKELGEFRKICKISEEYYCSDCPLLKCDKTITRPPQSWCYVESLDATETVGQYTGLCDKNGNKIFEGDIVKDYNGAIGFVDYMQKYSGFVIEPINSDKDIDIYGYVSEISGIEVIGNIHDNKELLEE